VEIGITWGEPEIAYIVAHMKNMKDRSAQCYSGTSSVQYKTVEDSI
jgi:hypothetical protein